MNEAFVFGYFPLWLLPSGFGFVFNLNCTWKKKIVFQMNVLMQIGLKFSQGLIQRLVADTGVLRRGVAVADLSQFVQQISGGVVFHRHHPHRILNRAKEWRRNFLAISDRFFHSRDIREQDLLFAQHVRDQILLQMQKDFA